MNKRIRSAIDHKLQHVTLSPSQKRSIYAKTVDRAKIRRKLSASLVAALVALLLLTGIAFATGIAQSVFRAMRGMYTGEDPSKYEQLEALSNRSEISVPLEHVQDGRFTLIQSYYDGEQLMMAYTLDAPEQPVDFTFGPDHARFKDLQPGKLGFTVEDGEAGQFHRMRAEKGSLGMIKHNVYLSDRVKLLDGTDLPNYNERTTADGTYMEFLLPLPKAARNKDELTLVLKIKRSTLYYYEDATDGYYFHDNYEPDFVTVTVKRTTDKITRYAATYETEHYRARASAQASPVNVRATITLDVPPEWRVLEDTFGEPLPSGLDMIFEYALVVDGKSHSAPMHESWDGNTVTWEGAYAVAPTDLSEVRLRPVYSIRGEVPEEDLVLTPKG